MLKMRMTRNHHL